MLRWPGYERAFGVEGAGIAVASDTMGKELGICVPLYGLLSLFTPAMPSLGLAFWYQQHWVSMVDDHHNDTTNAVTKRGGRRSCILIASHCARCWRTISSHWTIQLAQILLHHTIVISIHQALQFRPHAGEPALFSPSVMSLLPKPPHPSNSRTNLTAALS